MNILENVNEKIALPIRLGNVNEVVAKLAAFCIGVGGFVLILVLTYKLKLEYWRWPYWVLIAFMLTLMVYPLWLALKTPWKINLLGDGIHVHFLFAYRYYTWEQVTEMKIRSVDTYWDDFWILRRYPAIWIEFDDGHSARVLLSRAVAALLESVKIADITLS